MRAMAPRYDAVVASVFVRAASASGRMDLAAPLQRLLQDIARTTRRVRNASVRDDVLRQPVRGDVPAGAAGVLLTYDFYDRAEASAVRAHRGRSGDRRPAADRAAGDVRARGGVDAHRGGPDWRGPVSVI